jgi:hypothetical protein
MQMRQKNIPERGQGNTRFDEGTNSTVSAIHKVWLAIDQNNTGSFRAS